MGKDCRCEVQGLAVHLEQFCWSADRGGCQTGTGELVQQRRGVGTVLPRSLAEERAESQAAAAGGRDVSMLTSG